LAGRRTLTATSIRKVKGIGLKHFPGNGDVLKCLKYDQLKEKQTNNQSLKLANDMNE
jgi:hypothetical protein